MVLKLGNLRKKVINDSKRLTCGAEEGWRRAVGPIV
jgi:hypothetical protein